MRHAFYLWFSLLALPLAAVVRRGVDAWRTYEATGAAAQFGLTYGARLPLDWLLVGIVTSALVAGAAVSFHRYRSRARWLFGAAALAALASTIVGARDLAAWSVLAAILLVFAASLSMVVADRLAGGHSRPSWLTDRGGRLRGLVTGGVLLAVGVAVAFAEDERVLPRSRTVRDASWIVAISGGLLFLVAIFGALLAWARERRSKGATVAVVGFLAALLFAGFATYSLGFHWKETVSLCRYGVYGDSIDDRRRATAAGSERARSVFSILPDLVFHFRYECDMAVRELEMIERGECPQSPLKGVPCRCGAEDLPRDARCERPECVALSPPRTRCPADPW
ncbi:MAG: hypothetical protein WKG00_15915 [Polyangiaceae bacterium]